MKPIHLPATAFAAIVSCVVAAPPTSGNSAVNGGAISIGYVDFFAPSNFTAFVTNCTFFGNTATASGGAVSATGSGVFMNCLFYENSAATGGAIAASSSTQSVTMRNCTHDVDRGTERFRR